MRKLIIISAATAAVLFTISTVNSAVAVLERSQPPSSPSAQHHAVHVADAGHMLRRGHMPLLMP